MSRAAVVEWSKCLVKDPRFQVRGRPKSPLVVVRRGIRAKNAQTLKQSLTLSASGEKREKIIETSRFPLNRHPRDQSNFGGTVEPGYNARQGTS